MYLTYQFILKQIKLFIPFSSIVGFAKHLAVIYGHCAASAPSGDVVSIIYICEFYCCRFRERIKDSLRHHLLLPPLSIYYR